VAVVEFLAEHFERVRTKDLIKFFRGRRTSSTSRDSSALVLDRSCQNGSGRGLTIGEVWPASSDVCLWPILLKKSAVAAQRYQ
jgi:hypothetical protein